MKKLKTAVIGVGHLGKFHAEKYQQLETTELIAVCDIDKPTCDKIAHQLQVSPVYDFRYLLDQVDAVSIVTPTMTHYTIAKFFLEAGVHILLEKPVSQTLNEVEDLIKAASQKQVIFQVGHIECFNPAVTTLNSLVYQPKLIEATRVGPFQPRNLDISIVLDLMIHDIDIIHAIHPVPIKQIEAIGLPMMSDFHDMANVRLLFEDGCVACLTASRIAQEKKRSMTVYQENTQILADFQAQSVTAFHKGGLMQWNTVEHPTQRIDTLLTQINAFIESIRLKQPPKVGGEQAKKALKTALAISSSMVEREKSWA